jgi:hypothetical protein
MRHMWTLGLAMFVCVLVAVADEVPLTGTVKAVDPTAQTLLVEAVAKGKSRQVTVEIRPASKIVRLVPSTDPAKPGFTEQPIALADIKVGWLLNVTTRHEGQKEVAETIRVVMER